MATPAQNAWVTRVLGAELAGAATAEPELDVEGEKIELKALGLEVSDVWQSAVAAFAAANEAVNVQIGALQAALRESDDPDLLAIADAGLNALTDNTRVPLQAAIMDAGNGGPKLKAAAPRVLGAVAAFRAQLASEQIRACDTNPFDVPVAIADTFDNALDQLDYAARLAA